MSTLLPQAGAQDDARIQALAGATPARVWRIVAIVQFLLLLLVGGGVALLAALESGPFAPGGTVAAAKTGDVWTCPMHPQIRQDHPGSCPICGMTLVKAEPQSPHAPPDGDHPQHALPGLAPVTVPLTILQHGGVRTARAAQTRMGDEVLTVGRVEADETRVAHVHSQVMGWVTKLYVNQTGQFVARGDLLLDLFSRDILQTQQELLAVGGRRGGAAGVIGGPVNTLADAARQRLLVYGVPPDVIEEVERTGRALATVPLRSPETGFVLMKNVVQGMYVEPGTEMFTIAGLSNVWVWADLYEVDLERVHLGDRAETRTLGLGDRVFEGHVTFLSPEVDMTTRTLRARIEIPNPDLALRPGMWASIRIVGGERDVLAVPYDAVIDTGTDTYVFVQTGEDEFTARRVVAGWSADGLTEIREGLRAGDTVVASGTFLIDSESRIRGGGAPAAVPEPRASASGQPLAPQSPTTTTTTSTSTQGAGGMANMPGM